MSVNLGKNTPDIVAQVSVPRLCLNIASFDWVRRPRATMGMAVLDYLKQIRITHIPQCMNTGFMAILMPKLHCFLT